MVREASVGFSEVPPKATGQGIPIRASAPYTSNNSKPAFTAKYEVYQYNLQLPLLLFGESPFRKIPEVPLLPCHESCEETTAISAPMSLRIRTCFKQLAAAYAEAENPPANIMLEIEIQWQDFEPETPQCDHRRYHSRRLRLHDPEMLPDLPFVTSWSIRSRANGSNAENGTDVRPLSILVALQCLVHLSRVRAWIARWLWVRPMPACMSSRVKREHYTWPWEGPLRDARHEFGAAIMEQEKYLCGRRIPAGLTRAALHFWPWFLRPKHDQSVARPNLIHPADKDPVSVGLCKLGAQMSVFDVRAVVTPDLFPRPNDQQWSQMRRFRLEFQSLRPDGRW